MISNVRLQFVQSPEASSDSDASDVDTSPFTAGGVERVDYQAALSELYELKVIVTAHEDNVDPKKVVGKFVEVEFFDQPFVAHLRGIVRRLRQLTTEPTGLSRYELTAVPPLWLMTQRTNSRIFQNVTVEDIVKTIGKETLGAAFMVPKFDLVNGMPPAREYRVQYDETDYKFVSRILAEEGLTWFFDAKGAWTITDDTTSKSTVIAVSSARPAMATFSGEAVIYRPGTATIADPHVTQVSSSVSLATTSVVLRDYDYARPPHDKESLDPLEATQTIPGGLDLDTGLETYRFEVGKLKNDSVGLKRAQFELEAERAMSQTHRFETSFMVAPGSFFKMADHPRSELNVEMLVVRATMSAHETEMHHVTECIARAIPFRPAYVPKPRIFGTQTGFVVTDSLDEEISVDEKGRVRVYFPWDRRQKAVKETTRLVRVSQGWAGAGYGFMMIPRRMQEVVVTFLNGDPDEPLIVGRVHNETEPPPLKLPEQKTQSIWLSRSSPTPANASAGFNKIMMEDKSGSELLETHAQKDFKSHTNRDESITVGRNQSTSVVGSESHSANDITISAQKFIKVNAGTTIDVHANGGYLKESASTDVEIHALGGDLTADASANLKIHAKGGDLKAIASANMSCMANGGDFKARGSADAAVHAGSGTLTCDAGTNVMIHAKGGKVKATGSAMFKATAPISILHGSGRVHIYSGTIVAANAPSVTIHGTGSITITGGTVAISGSAVTVSGGPITMTGTPIKLNC